MFNLEVPQVSQVCGKNYLGQCYVWELMLLDTGKIKQFPELDSYLKEVKELSLQTL